MTKNEQKKYKPTRSETKKYVLSKNTDIEILTKCKQLEKMKLKKEDKFLIKLIKTQLEDAWRKPLLKTLNKLLDKYKKRHL